jgi:hypothetical protein
MSPIRRHSRMLLVGVSCAAIGGGASAIASAGASTGASAHATKHARAVTTSASRGRLARFAQRAVHGDVVVHTKKGFVNVTFDRGKVDSISGRQLTLTEGTPKASYETVTVTVPANAVVRDNGRRAALTGVTPGQRVLVLTAPHRTYVIAHTAHARG